MDPDANKCQPRPLALLCKMRRLDGRDVVESVENTRDLINLRSDLSKLDEELQSERSTGMAPPPGPAIMHLVMLFVDGAYGLPSATKGASKLAALLTETAGTELSLIMADAHARASLAQLLLLADPQREAKDLTSAMIAASPEAAASVVELAMSYMPAKGREDVYRVTIDAVLTVAPAEIRLSLLASMILRIAHLSAQDCGQRLSEIGERARKTASGSLNALAAALSSVSAPLSVAWSR